MAKIGCKATKTVHDNAKKNYGSRPLGKGGECGGYNPAMSHVLRDPMTITGRYLYVSGKDAKQERLRVSEVMELLDGCKPPAKFVGKHAGRLVVAQRHRVTTTVEFVDVRSAYLPPL